MAGIELILGQVLTFTEAPFGEDPAAAVRHERRGGVAIGEGRILATGDADSLITQFPAATRHDHGDALVLPGFVDAHAHYPQTRMIASWGKRLIDWLNTYTFPEERKFADPDYAAATANLYLDLLLANGTTSVVSFCTIHPESVDAFFEAAAARDMRVVAGKTCMDRNAPDYLRDTAQSAYDDSKRLLQAWHGRGRAVYAVTPRFSPTSTPEQLAAMGALWAEHADCPMQTHLSEQLDEIAWVKGLHPEARDYLDTYEAHGLVGPGALFGHAIHLEPREIDRLKAAGAGLIHCPTSNAFIGSGVMAVMDLCRSGQKVGLATDTGGGSSFSMLRTMAAAYDLGQLRGTPLHAAQLLWLATEGSARALRMEDRIGTLAPGSEADITVLNLASTPAIAQRAAMAGDLWEAVFPTIMMGDDRAVRQVWVAGRKLRG